MAVAKAQRERARAELHQQGVTDDARDAFRTPVKQFEQRCVHVLFAASMSVLVCLGTAANGLAGATCWDSFQCTISL